MVIAAPMLPSTHSRKAASLNHCTLGYEVEDVRGPVLNGRRVAHARERPSSRRFPLTPEWREFSSVDRGGAALDVVDVRALVGDDEHALKPDRPPRC